MSGRTAGPARLRALAVLAWAVLATAGPVRAADTTGFSVFFGRIAADVQPAAECGQVLAVPRSVPRTPAVAAAALRQLFAGPSEAERAAGWRSPFSAATADLLRGVRIAGGTAYVNLADRREALAVASSSCGGAELQAAIGHTLRQFPAVRRVIVAIDGEPRRFYEWLGVPCDAANGHCSARPFQAAAGRR